MLRIMLRRLEPAADPVDLLDLVFSEKRERRGRPWVMFNMVESVDGATAVEGGSTALNDADDRALFESLRAVPDVILVGAETVRSEDYGPVRLDDERRRRRRAAGLEEVPHLVILTRSLNLDPRARVFSDPDHRPMVLTGYGVDRDRLETVSRVADVIQVHDLGGRGIVDHLRVSRVILCEGGPTINGILLADGMVDEINLTVSPVVALGDSFRIAEGDTLDSPIEMRLDRVLRGDRSLFLRYLRD